MRFASISFENWMIAKESLGSVGKTLSASSNLHEFCSLKKFAHSICEVDKETARVDVISTTKFWKLHDG
jgi:hypothetical protein